MILRWLIARLQRKREYKKCRANMGLRVDAQMEHRVRTQCGSYLGDMHEFDWERWGGMPQCPAGGTYTIELGNPENSFTVFCANDSHNIGPPDEPTGFSPGLNAR